MIDFLLGLFVFGSIVSFFAIVALPQIAADCKGIKEYRVSRKNSKIVIQFKSKFFPLCWYSIGTEWAINMPLSLTEMVDERHIDIFPANVYSFRELEQALRIRDGLNKYTKENQTLDYSDLYYQKAIEELESLDGLDKNEKMLEIYNDLKIKG